MIRRVLVRADSGLGVGAGHMVRCLALAGALTGHGAQVAFVCGRRPGALLELPARAGFLLHDITGDLEAAADAEATCRFARQWSADLAIVDHYGFDAGWDSAVRNSTGALLCIADMADRRHACDWLLDQNDMRPHARRYVELVPACCDLLLGPGFALLRPEFRRARRRCGPRGGGVRRILVFFSGSDEGNETAIALQGMAALGRDDWWVDVVIGALHPDAAGIEAMCARQGWHLHRQTDRMADLLMLADLSVGAAGSASWERCALGVPALIVELADNQREVVASLVARGCATLLGRAGRVGVDGYAHALASLQAAEVAAMSKAAWDLVDGEGAERVAGLLVRSRP